MPLEGKKLRVLVRVYEGVGEYERDANSIIGEAREGGAGWGWRVISVVCTYDGKLIVTYEREE